MMLTRLQMQLAGLGLLLLVLAGLYFWGVHNGVRSEKQRAERAAHRMAEKRQVITSKAETKAVEAQEVIQWRTRTLVRKVPIYVTREADAHCTVSVGAIRLFNAAARGELPRTPAGSDGEAGSTADPAGPPF